MLTFNKRLSLTGFKLPARNNELSINKFNQFNGKLTSSFEVNFQFDTIALKFAGFGIFRV